MSESLEFLPIFLDEAVEILEQWEAACLALEKDPGDEVLDRLFRAAHNLKGSSRSVGLHDFGTLVHRTEDVINMLRERTIDVTADTVALLLDVQAALMHWVDILRRDSTGSFDAKHLIERLGKYQKIEVAEPQAFGFFDEPTSAPNTAQAATATPPAPVDINHTPPASKSDETIRVSLKKLDTVIRLIGELSIQQAIIKNAKETNQFDSKQAQDAITLANKGIQDLQTEAMSLRMQPLETFFQRLERVARDVARQQGKAIEVHLRGTDVELDKTVIERMKDPMVHLLRNAVDHGIEDGRTRETQNKPLTATITIEAIYTAASVSIRISDDGRGLDHEKILATAKARGVLPAHASPSRQEIHQLIFMPGFSTASKVTDVSGRGVGMDVVKRSVDELNGSIFIETNPGLGTTFQISLPSSLSIVDALIIGLGQSLYAVPIQDIDEVIELDQSLIESTTKRGRVLCHRGEVVPIERLIDYLPIPGHNLQTARAAIVGRLGEKTVAFEVDSIEGQQPIVARNLEGGLAPLPGFSGGTILANGDPAMIIQMPHIVRSFLALAG